MSPLVLLLCVLPSAVEVSPQPTAGQAVTLAIPGPRTSETGTPNPFREVRCDVTFTHSDDTREPTTCHGFFAADGNAAQTGAAAGAVWQVRFVPSRPGTWTYRVSLRSGKDVALTDPADAGEPTTGDGLSGSFDVAAATADAPGFLGDGLIHPADSRYLTHTRSGRPFLKIGADSPENLLAYADFDGTTRSHKYAPHRQDWATGDPTWGDGRGKALVGALNYLAAQGVNSIYFLPMNVAGDGKDVWPWIAADTRDRFDVSKLDQWEIVFTHAQRLGIALHVVLTETENESLFEALDGPGDGPGDGEVPFADSRRLYYRELVARFGHHTALFWNLGEENGGGNDKLGAANSTAQRLAFAATIKQLDGGRHPVVVHTFPNQYDKIYAPLLGQAAIDGPSLQMGDPRKSHAETLKWIRKSREASRPWFVCVDEIGPANTGVVPDDDPTAAENHRLAREVLWGNLLAGGAGVEWYFGYKYHDSDLKLEDFRSRAEVWNFSKAAVNLLRALPLEQMASADDLVRRGAFCLAQPGQVYAVYLPPGVPAEMTLPAGTYSVEWFHPLNGSRLASEVIERGDATPRQSLGALPSSPTPDRVLLVRRVEN